jgi:hypothetical protein
MPASLMPIPTLTVNIKANIPLKDNIVGDMRPAPLVPLGRWDSSD